MGRSEHWLVREVIENCAPDGTVQIKRDAFSAAELRIIRDGLAAHGFNSMVVGTTIAPGVEFWEADN